MIRVIWTGDDFRPISGRFHRLCAEKFGQGEVLDFDPERPRSMVSHNHEFAALADMWASLPESLSEMPYAKSPETLRKHALIATGFCDVQTVACGSAAAAERVAAFSRNLACQAHGYAVVSVEGSTVRVFTPESQSMRAMGAKRFGESKRAILEWVDGLLGVRA